MKDKAKRDQEGKTKQTRPGRKDKANRDQEGRAEVLVDRPN